MTSVASEERLQQVKNRVQGILGRYPESSGFAPEVLKQLRFVDLRLKTTPDGREMAETVHEIEVTSNMLNGKVSLFFLSTRGGEGVAVMPQTHEHPPPAFVDDLHAVEAYL